MANYIFEQEELTCVSLEKNIGLKSGAIKEVTIYADGAVEIVTAIDLTADQQAKVKDFLSKKGYPKGRKPSKQGI